MKKLKELLVWKNVAYYLIMALMLVLLISPQVKVLIISAMMKIGFMRPPTENIVNLRLQNIPGPSLLLRSADGRLINTAQLNGKVLLINFWANWCPPCRAEMPSINELYLHYKNNPEVEVLPVDVDGDFKKSIGFMKVNGYQLPVYQVVGNMPEGLMSNSIPTTVIFDKKGTIVARHEGAADYTDKAFYRYIDRLLSVQ